MLLLGGKGDLGGLWGFGDLGGILIGDLVGAVVRVLAWVFHYLILILNDAILQLA